MGDSVKVSLASMVDLALCSPEIGAVNFNILRSLLLMMLQRLGLSDFTGELSEKEVAATKKTEVKKPAPKKVQKKVTTTEKKEGKPKDEAIEEPVRPSQVEEPVRESQMAEEQTIRISEAYGDSEVDQAISSLRDDLNSLRGDVDQIIDEVRSLSELAEKVPFEALYNSVKEIDDLKSKLEELTVKLSDKSAEDDETGGEAKDDPASIHIHELEEKLSILNDQVQGLDSNFTSQIEGLIEQIGALECDLGRLMEQMNTDQPEGDAMTQDFTGMGELQTKLQQLQSDMEHVNQVATKLMDDEGERQLQYEALVEQVEVLKMVKADREVVEDALAEKADQVVVNRKVSHEQFDNACDDLARGLDEAFTKLCQQETIWKNALDDVQNEMGQKLDKVELTPLRDFIQQRLKVLQDKLKALAARKEQEAAGTKKYLRDVNCISCDKDVVMKRQLDTPSVPIQPSLPPTRSIRPYVTYELDKLRHQQKRPMGKNLIQLEDMEQEYEKKARREKSPSEEEPEHLVNRYCGGSHTVIAPHQRVMRAGQPTQPTPGFTEISIRGTDGQLYLGQEMPKTPPKKSEATEATQTSETLIKKTKEGSTAKGESKKPPPSPKSPTSAKQGSKSSKVAFAESHQESSAAQG